MIWHRLAPASTKFPQKYSEFWWVHNPVDERKGTWVGVGFMTSSPLLLLGYRKSYLALPRKKYRNLFCYTSNNLSLKKYSGSIWYSNEKIIIVLMHEAFSSEKTYIIQHKLSLTCAMALLRPLRNTWVTETAEQPYPEGIQALQPTGIDGKTLGARICSTRLTFWNASETSWFAAEHTFANGAKVTASGPKIEQGK